MKTMVIYCSQTGFTRRYAQWLAEAAGADCLPLAEARRRDLGGYDAIVYGGWARAGRIRGIGWFRRRLDRWAGKRLAAFCVGASPADSPDIPAALRQSLPETEQGKVAVFYCPGGLCYEKMSAPSRWAMGLFARMIGAKREKTEAEAAMARMLRTSYDLSDRRYIAPILAYLAS